MSELTIEQQDMWDILKNGKVTMEDMIKTTDKNYIYSPRQYNIQRIVDTESNRHILQLSLLDAPPHENSGEIQAMLIVATLPKGKYKMTSDRKRRVLISNYWDSPFKSRRMIESRLIKTRWQFLLFKELFDQWQP